MLYLQQEGRGIGLANKVAAYGLQQAQGLDTVDANLHLGLPGEMRGYACVPHILQARSRPPVPPKKWRENM